MAYSAFDRGGAASPGPQGRPAESYMPQRSSSSTDRPAEIASDKARTGSRFVLNLLLCQVLAAMLEEMKAGMH